MRHIIRPLAILATALAVGTTAAHAQDTTHTPVTPKQVGKNVRSETHRVANRTQDAVRKAGNQTEAQAHRTTKAVKRTVRPDTTTPPVTPEQVGKNVRSETHRVGNRTQDAVHKAGKQTEAQAHRTGKSLKKVVSRKARHDTTE